MKVQPWNYRAGVHISPRYPTMRNRRIVVTISESEWEEGADEPTTTIIRTEEHPCEPDAYDMADGYYTAAHKAAKAIVRTYYASPIDGFDDRYEDVYEHPHRNLREVADLELRGFRPDEIARVRKILRAWKYIG